MVHNLWEAMFYFRRNKRHKRKNNITITNSLSPNKITAGKCGRSYQCSESIRWGHLRRLSMLHYSRRPSDGMLEHSTPNMWNLIFYRGNYSFQVKRFAIILWHLIYFGGKFRIHRLPIEFAPLFSFNMACRSMNQDWDNLNHIWMLSYYTTELALLRINCIKCIHDLKHPKFFP